MGQFRSNLYFVGWPKKYLFTKSVIQVDINLTQMRLYSTQTQEKHVVFECICELNQTLSTLHFIQNQ